MTALPSRTFYHRWLGWHAVALRRAILVVCIGLVAAVVLLRFVSWQLAVVAGWDTAALVFLGAVWPIIIRADGSHTKQLASREDETRGSAAMLLLAASVVSLVGAGIALSLAGQRSGTPRLLLIGVAVLTVVLSWTVVNTVYVLRYAHLYVGQGVDGITFGDGTGPDQPSYRDFAYVAFTVGMTYQVSDTAIRHPRIRGAVLSQALLAYLFGVVIVAGSINLIAGLIR